MKKPDLLIIGGGASGLFCAVNSAWQGKRVLVVEHENKCGKKLLITGKGRCNVTNNCDVETVLKNLPRNSKFMYSSLYGFTPQDTMSFFESLGIKLKTERGNRVFPESDRAEDIRGVLVNAAREAGVFFVRDEARELIIEDGRAVGVRCAGGEYTADKVVVATGGKSYPTTGSTGDGYRLARQAGHHVTEISPSLCPIVIKGNECAEMMGLSLRNCTLSLYRRDKEKPLFSELGEMLFTHYGMSGPLVLSASAHMEKPYEDYCICIDLKPALSCERLDARIQRDFKEFPNKDFENALHRLLPAKLIPIAVKRSGVDGTKKVNQITREERQNLVRQLKCMCFSVKDLRPIEEAIITRGGVDVSEISPKTMESRLVKGLYFIGEVLDVDGYTGGFNLQVAFATANAVRG